MAETLKERKDINPQDLWDLTPIYASDEVWEEEFAKTETLAEQFQAYPGTLGQSPEHLREFYDLLYGAFEKMERLNGYAFQRKSEDNRQDAAQSMYSRSLSRYVQLASAVSFVDPEILALPDDVLDRYLAADCLQSYRHVLENTIRTRKHTLTAPEEAILASLSEVTGSFGDIAEMLTDADFTFDAIPNPEKEGETIELTESNYILLQRNQNRAIREAAFRSYYKTYKGHNNTFAAMYSTQVKSDAVHARLRKYPSSVAWSLSSNNIPVSVYDSLVETIHEFMPLMYRYVALRKKMLGLDELHYYDVYAPLVKDVNKTYTYEEAKALLLEAVAPLGEDYVNTVKKGLADRWVDVYPNVGKSGGAYSIGTRKDHPNILMNFNGTLDDVSTLCHEMGHSMHTYLTHQKQPVQYDDYALFIAEVASTVNENLLVETLLKKTDDRDMKLFLLNEYMEGFKGTIFRQTMFAEFEKICHDRIDAGEALSSTALNDIYRDLIKQYFGPDLVIDDEVAYEWSRIPHFYRSFYVYQYATGYSSAVALSEAILHEGAPAVKRYLEFLSLGSSVYCLDALKHGGVDLSTPEPVRMAMKKFEKILDMAEALVNE